MLSENYLQLGTSIVELLRTDLDANLNAGVVKSAPCVIQGIAGDDDIEAALQNRSVVVTVAYMGDFDDTSRSGVTETAIKQAWMVLVSVQHISGVDAHTRTTEVAGAYMSGVRKCLTGKQLDPEASPLKQLALTDLRGRPSYTAEGSHFPMFFTSNVRMHSNVRR